MKVEALQRPLSLTDIRDGGVYSLDVGRLPRTGLFLNVGRIDDVFVKMPSRRGLADYFAFVRFARSTPNEIRALEDRERFERLDSTLEQFPDFKEFAISRPELVHYLVVHKLQYERLRADAAVGIPATRFVLLRSGSPGGDELQPAFFQERVEGTTLWEMFDFSARGLTQRWQSSQPAISRQLAQLLASGLSKHIDWNIQNFVFREVDQRLFYVDLKPTLFAALQTNELNLSGIRRHFVD